MNQVTKKLISDFLKMLGVEESSISFGGDEIFEIDVTVSEDIKGMLIGRHAQTLDSLQLILSLMVNNEQENHQRLLLDIGGYRKERLDKIIDSADQIANIVMQTGQPKALPRLSPTERRQIHMHFSNNEKFTTFSQGEGEDRRLFIALAS